MFKNLLIKNYNATICEILMQASKDSVDSILLNCDSWTNTGAPRGLTKKYTGKMFYKTKKE